MFSVIRASRPYFSSREDALAFSVHAYLLTQDYKVVATGADSENDSRDWLQPAEEVDIGAWNGLEGIYSFRYQDIKGVRPPLYVKCLPVGSILLVHWIYMSESDKDPHTLELDVNKYTTGDLSPGGAYQNNDELTKTLDRAFVVPQQSGLATNSGAQATTTGTRVAEGNEPYYSDQGRGRLEGGGNYPGGRFYPATGVGMQDVVPPGFRAPGLPPDHGDLSGLMEGPPMRGGGGGMMVGPDHPMFGPGRLQGGVPGRGGSSSLPPGARWDPIGPPGTRGFRPDDFVPDRSKPHPDMMQPGPDKGTDWDAYFG